MLILLIKRNKALYIVDSLFFEKFEKIFLKNMNKSVKIKINKPIYKVRSNIQLNTCDNNLRCGGYYINYLRWETTSTCRKDATLYSRRNLLW